MSKKIPVYAWYFPNWHLDERNALWHGKGWTEWECVKHASPRFEGHKIYHPLWGYEDESDPKVMEKKIDAALTHGVDGFLWDFYWFNDTFGEGDTAGSFRLRALNEGFFGARNNVKCKIALMLCYEDMIYGHPASYWSANRQTATGRLTPDGFYRVTQYMIDKYFWRENYLRVEDKVYFVLYHARNFISSMGGEHGARLILDDFRARVRAAGLGELYIACVPGSLDVYRNGDKETATAYLKSVGIDGCVSYSWPESVKPDAVWPSYPYRDFVDGGIATFAKSTEKIGLPMNITVSQGWDPSPRTVPSDMYDKIGYPYSFITDGKNPDDFERALRAAKDFFRSDKSTGDFITLSTWNEWTEGNFMEPSVEDGYAYLDKVKKVFVDEA